MAAKTPYRLILITAPDLETARKLSRAALESRLVACANLVPAIESHYWWQGRIESGTEVLVLLKTTDERISALQHLVLEQHPYDTAAFVVLPLEAGSPKYLAWIMDSVRFPE
jgi:periplasmic divalent cation tolerance protein